MGAIMDCHACRNGELRWSCASGAGRAEGGLLARTQTGPPCPGAAFAAMRPCAKFSIRRLRIDRPTDRSVLFDE